MVREHHQFSGHQIRSDQSLSRVWLFATPWIAVPPCPSPTPGVHPDSLTSIKSVMPSSHLILCHPLLLLPPVPPSIRVFSNESTLRMRWPKYWSFSFSIIPSKEIPGLISFRMDWLDISLSKLQEIVKTGNPEVLQSIGPKRVGHDWRTTIVITIISLTWFWWIWLLPFVQKDKSVLVDWIGVSIFYTLSYKLSDSTRGVWREESREISQM